MIATETYSWNKSQKVDMVSLKAALAVVTSRTARIDGLMGMFEELQNNKSKPTVVPRDGDSFNVSDLDDAASRALHDAKTVAATCSPDLNAGPEEKVEDSRPRRFDDGDFGPLGNAPDTWSGADSDSPDEEDKGPVWNDGCFGQLDDESDAQSATKQQLLAQLLHVHSLMQLSSHGIPAFRRPDDINNLSFRPDVAEVFGAAACVLRIAELCVPTATKPYHHAREIQSSPVDIQAFALQVRVTFDVLQRPNHQL